MMKKLLLILCIAASFSSFGQEPELVRVNYPGSGNYSQGTFRQITAVGDMLFFVTDDGMNGSELFKSDGTTVGTTLVKDIYSGAASSDPRDLISFKNKLFFFAYTGGFNLDFWKTDGTEAGTVKIKSVDSGSSSSGENSKLVIGDTMYFSGSVDNSGSELWKTDGTTEGTVLIKDIYSGSVGSNPSDFVNLNGVLYFVSDDNDVNGAELWKSDGTEVGTIKIKDFNPSNNSDSNLKELTVVGNTLYFIADDGTHGSELWKSDGTEAGTVMVKDIRTVGDNNLNSSFGGLTAFGNLLFFRGLDTTDNGAELWKSDGTEAGTVMVKDIRMGVVNWGTSSSPYDLSVIGNMLYFVADDGVNGVELWKSDGTEAGTVMVKDIYPGTVSGVYNDGKLVIGNHIFFGGRDDTHGKELWKSDGTEAGTVMIKDINPGLLFETQLQISDRALTSNGILYFLAFDGVNGTKPSLWKLDVSSVLGVEEEKLDKLGIISAYPNPTSGILSLKIENQEIQTVKVYSLFGKEVMRVKAEENNPIKNINLQYLANGMYLIKIKTAKNTFTQKIIKK